MNVTQLRTLSLGLSPWCPHVYTNVQATRDPRMSFLLPRDQPEPSMRRCHSDGGHEMFSIKPCFTTTALPRLSLLPGVPLLAREGVSGATPAGAATAGLHSPPVPALSASPRGQPSESRPQVPGRGVDTAQPPCSCPICWGVGDMSPRGRRHVEGCGWGSKGGPHPRVVLTRPSGCWGHEVAPGCSNVQGRWFGRTLPIEWKTGCKASVKVHSCGDASWKEGTRGTI